MSFIEVKQHTFDLIKPVQSINCRIYIRVLLGLDSQAKESKSNHKFCLVSIPVLAYFFMIKQKQILLIKTLLTRQ